MSISEVNSVTTSADADAAEFVAGFRRLEAEIRAVGEQELEPINLDVPSAVATVLGALPEIRAFRGEVSELAGFDLLHFDRLRDYALALAHTHSMYRAASGPIDGLTELAEEAAELRDTLQSDAAALAKRRILDSGAVSRLRGGNGYKNIAIELAGLVGLFRENWASIEGRTAIRLEELEHAGRRAQELLIATGLREQAPVAVNAASALRQRAFTLFVRAYGQARRAIAYLRWDRGDADDIAPSLYKGRGGRGEPDVVTPPEAPPVQNPQTPAPVASPAVPAGLPGSSPFVSSRG